jgi:hypothetical protein
MTAIPRRRRLPALALALSLVLLTAACGDSAGPANEFTTEWPDDRPLPVATVEATSTESGILLEFELVNFVISSPAAEDADGHLHIAVDGGEALMTHETTVELGELAPGTHEVHVGFAGNDHRTIAVDGKDLMSMVLIEVAPDGSVVASGP